MPLPPQQPNQANGQSMPAYPFSPGGQQQQQFQDPQALQLNPLAARPDMQKIAMLRAAMSNPRIRGFSFRG
jgi:hypothetical protein